MDWLAALREVGVPIGSALGVAWFAKGLIEQQQDAAAKREAQLISRLQEQDALITGRLFQMSADQVKALTACTEAVAQLLHFKEWLNKLSGEHDAQKVK